MKVKELDKTVNLAWSPAALTPVMLAAGTAAQQLDASFSTSASLDIYHLNLDEPGLDMELRSSIQSENRFHKLVWGACGSGSVGSGVIVGGCDNGRLQMHNAAQVLAGDEGLICTPDRHTGPVKAIDFNSFQTNLFSTGASDSEIFIWDLNQVKTPMTPGKKSEPAEEVVWLSWNKQVQHILASAFSTRCVVWDLRKNEPIIKLSDSNSRVRWKVVAWHPDVATQLCLASEDDSNPVVQLWDLRFATTPIKTLEGHQKGVLSIAWCAQDPDLLVSCGKDSRILCWNPAATQPGEELVCEMETSNQWNFEVSWCPRNPSLIATTSFDGHASIFSLVGGQQQMQTTNKIADSFPGMEQYADAPVVQPPQHSHSSTIELRKAPKWLKRPVGASFGFGGKLVSFSPEGVVVSQVITEPVLVEQSRRLQQLLSAGQLRDVCYGKTEPVWSFVAASLEPDFRMSMRVLLGFTQEQLELNKYIGQPVNSKLSDIDGLAEDFSVLSQDGSDDEGRLNNSSVVSNSFDITQNNINHFNSNGSEDNFIASNKSPFKIKTGEDKEGVICRALLAGNVELAVDLCVQEGRMTDAIILATSAGPDVLARTQYKYFQQNQNYLSYLVNAVVTRDWGKVVSGCDLSSWAEALAAVLTYASDDLLPSLCERLGDRLEREGDADSHKNSEICFIAAGQLGHLIQNRIASDLSTEALQELVELVLVARQGSGHGQSDSSRTAFLLDRYAQLLAAQGDFNTALAYLSTSQDEDIEELRERLYIATGQKPYPMPQQQQSSYYQNASQSKYSAGYGKPVKQPQVPSYQQPPMHNSSAFPPSTNQQYPAANQPYASQTVPSVTPPRKPSISNPLITSFQSSTVNNFAPPVPSFPAANSTYAQTNSFPSSQSLFPSQPPVTPAPFQPTHSANTHAPSLSAFAPPSHSTQKPFAPSHPAPPPLSQTPVHSSTEPVPPPHSAATGPPPSFSQRSSPSPSLAANTRKYLVDPSLSGGGSTFRNSSSSPYINSNSNPYNSQPQSQQQQFSQPGSGLYNPQPQQQQFSQPGSGLYNSQPQQQQFSQPFHSMPPQPISHQPEPKPPQHFVPQMSAPPGWNDPPAAAANSRIKPKEAHQPPPPITHPLFSAAPQEMSMQQGPQMPMMQQQQHMPPMGMNMGESQQGYGYPGGPSMAPPPAPVAKAAEPPRPKPPLPDEHMYLQTVFEELRNRCTCAANNPQLRRKLEDVSRKLEVLYDALRENKMSSQTQSSLHQLVHMVQSGDYTSALHLHTQLVSGPDFSQISAFMPGLKALIQSALQLGVYLQ